MRFQMALQTALTARIGPTGPIARTVPTARTAMPQQTEKQRRLPTTPTTPTMPPMMPMLLSWKQGKRALFFRIPMMQLRQKRSMPFPKRRSSERLVGEQRKRGVA